MRVPWCQPFSYDMGKGTEFELASGLDNRRQTSIREKWTTTLSFKTGFVTRWVHLKIFENTN